MTPGQLRFIARQMRQASFGSEIGDWLQRAAADIDRSADRLAELETAPPVESAREWFGRYLTAAPNRGPWERGTSPVPGHTLIIYQDERCVTYEADGATLEDAFASLRVQLTAAESAGKAK